MPIEVDLSEELVGAATTAAFAGGWSVEAQIEYWAHIGKCALENSELPSQIVQQTMLALQEMKLQSPQSYHFG